MTKPVVLIAEELSPATIDALGPDFEVRHCDGANRDELLAALVDVDAVLIRSATKMDQEALAVAKRLKVVARAGVGLDNVDVKAATVAGVMVVNAPTSNITSAAELAVGLLLATARNIAPANQSLKGGKWKRSMYGGIELLDKTVGIVGLGRIGALTAERLAGFGVKLIAYDPYLSAARAGQLGVQLVSLDELLAESDFITVHLPKTPETLGLIGEEALKLVKPTVRIINAARGGIVDEQALANALREGRVAGAGIDVWAKEPCTESPLFEFESVVVTPHLGASTEEAQEKAGVAVAKSVRLALGGELVPDAVNVSGGVIAEEVRPGIALVEKLGRIYTALAGSIPAQLDIDVRGEITEHDVSIWKLAALKGLVPGSRRGDGVIRQRPLAGPGARLRGTPPDRPEQPGLPQCHHLAGNSGRRQGHQRRRHAHRSTDDREARGCQRLRPRGSHLGAHGLPDVCRPPRCCGQRWPRARRGRDQHRRHAGCT